MVVLRSAMASGYAGTTYPKVKDIPFRFTRFPIPIVQEAVHWIKRIMIL